MKCWNVTYCIYNFIVKKIFFTLQINETIKSLIIYFHPKVKTLLFDYIKLSYCKKKIFLFSINTNIEINVKLYKWGGCKQKIIFKKYFLLGLRLRLVRLGRLVWSVRNTCMCGKVFAHYKPGWSPIRKQVAAPVANFQSLCVIDFSHCAAPSHKKSK